MLQVLHSSNIRSHSILSQSNRYIRYVQRQGVKTDTIRLLWWSNVTLKFPTILEPFIQGLVLQ